MTGNDAAVTIANQQGNFQLNVMLPVIAHNLLQSITILGNAARLLADKAIAGFTVNRERVTALLDKNPILVTALNPVIGYDKAAQIAKKAYAEGRSLKDVAAEMTGHVEGRTGQAAGPAQDDGRRARGRNIDRVSHRVTESTEKSLNLNNSVSSVSLWLAIRGFTYMLFPLPQSDASS